MNFLKNLLDKFLGGKCNCKSEECKHSQAVPVKPAKKAASQPILEVYSPCDGELVAQKDIPDAGFSEGHMGQGIGIKPTDSSVVSFMTGKISVLFRTKHAYVIEDEKSGVSVMLHLGINTVNIDESKEAFTTTRKVNDLIKAKEELCSMNLPVIEKEATSTISALLIQNDNMEGKKVVHHVTSGEVKKGDLLMSVVPA